MKTLWRATGLQSPTQGLKRGLKQKSVDNVDIRQPRLTPLFCAGSGQQSVEYVVISFTGILTHNSILTEMHKDNKSPTKTWSVTHINDHISKIIHAKVSWLWKNSPFLKGLCVENKKSRQMQKETLSQHYHLCKWIFSFRADLDITCSCKQSIF